jgi:ABC-type polysaccharide/polyol phosphate export permease
VLPIAASLQDFPSLAMTNASLSPAAPPEPTAAERRRGFSGPSEVYEYDAAHSRYEYAWNDLRRALARPRLILTLVRTTFFNRYKNTALGAFWVTATTMLMITGLSILYGKILGADLKFFFPYVATGVIVWGLISTLVNDGAAAFILGASVFNQTPVAKSVFAFRAVGLAFLTFSFRVALIAVVLALTATAPSIMGVLLALCGLVIIAWTGFWFTLLFGTIGLRFRDVGELIAAVMTISFLLTPIFWQPSRLGEYAWAVNFNPFYHYINIVRGPLLGLESVGLSFVVTIGISILLSLASAFVFGQFARRLSYWS